MATHRLTAEIPSREEARAAITDLSHQGIDGGQIEVRDMTGGSLQDADREADRATDWGVARSMSHRLLRTIPIGAAMGALIGTLATIMLFDWPATVVLLAGSGGGLLAGSILGLVWGLALIPEMGEEWMDTHRPSRGTCCLVVVTGLDDHQALGARAQLKRHAIWVDGDTTT